MPASVTFVFPTYSVVRALRPQSGRDNFFEQRRRNSIVISRRGYGEPDIYRTSLEKPTNSFSITFSDADDPMEQALFQ
jgi:hypothetical protein